MEERELYKDLYAELEKYENRGVAWTKEQERVQVQQGRCKIRTRPKEPDQHRMVRIGREEMVHQGDGENAIWRSR